ncbi:hypothetical protein ONZ45_g15250 [Pleurotus djamor]|nr:hypothetical protein ONZ45_g18666 [Pleurotus djamor]KAJ8481614.1 hypothetical protein ONZ45_g15250 [Pleurotus djamor]
MALTVSQAFETNDHPGSVIQDAEKTPTKSEPPTFVSTFKASYDIQERVLNYCSIAEISRLAMTCWIIATIVTSHCKTNRNLETLLFRYFSIIDIPSFRKLQSLTSLIIGGQLALELAFWRTERVWDAPLELFVHHADAIPVAKWLQRHNYVLDTRTFTGSTIEEIYNRRLKRLPYGYLLYQTVAYTNDCNYGREGQVKKSANISSSSNSQMKETDGYICMPVQKALYREYSTRRQHIS